MKIWAEYIWIGGVEPSKRVKTLRSKGQAIAIKGPEVKFDEIPRWGFDGSSTKQAEGHFSDIPLVPVCFIPDPIRNISGTGRDILVLCETYNVDGTPHITNTRRRLSEAVQQYAEHEAWFGMEQEYTLYDKDGKRPLRWPSLEEIKEKIKDEVSAMVRDWDGSSPLKWPEGIEYPAPQGRYYCGVGSDEVYGEEIVEEHTGACLTAGLSLAGINAEVMPAQWEFQVGPLSALEVADQLWLARWLLYKVAAKYGASVKLDPKPMQGDWNGAGCHTNFSTKAMREDGGLNVIKQACGKLKKRHKEHMAVYGPFNEQRLTGRHETCPYTEFRWAPYDRGASIRIPIKTMRDGRGYLEDRRPAANIDPYEVCSAILETVCGNGFKPIREADVTP